jgi:phosphoribosylformylglycinamidine synthase II
VTEGGKLKVWFKGETVVDIPVTAIVDLCPVYKREYREPARPKQEALRKEYALPKDYNKTLLKLLASPTIADKEWVYRQYDHQVLTNTMLLPGADASVLRIKGTKKAVAMKLDGNSLYTYLDPRSGAIMAVAEACRNLACVGARPVGVTNCLNFGNPEKPEIMGQFKEVTEGMAEACNAFAIPVTGGNVSFYNDTEGISIYPTPVLGIVGLIRDFTKAVTPGFKKEGHTIVLLGENQEGLGGSEYLKALYDEEKGTPPAIDLKKEKAVQELCLKAIEGRLIQSAHDISEGGLAVCLAECCFFSRDKMGCRIDLKDDLRLDALLFGEAQSRIVVSVQVSKMKNLLELAKKKKVPATVIGKTGGKNIQVIWRGKKLISLLVQQGFKAWKDSIPDFFKIK